MSEKFRETGLGIKLGNSTSQFDFFFAFEYLKPLYLVILPKLYVKFWPYESIILTFFWAKKSFSGLFECFFWRLSEVVWALFSTLIAPSFVVFSARKVGIWPPKTRNVGANFSLLRRPFRPFSCPKKWFLEHFESCFGVFQKLFGHCFWHIKDNFWFYFDSKCW